MPKEYYFISDLHIGSDSINRTCDFEKELIQFLKGLESKDKNTELMIVGDTFGMWEITKTKGLDKLKYIIKNYKNIFDQFKKTGEKIRITIIPGNHDHELACYKGFKPLLKKYNINLEAKEHITRKIGDKVIWIEHGNKYDDYNKVEEFGNPMSKPFGYHFAHRIILAASKRADKIERKWIKDMKSVQPNEHIPKWIFSNYFYRELNPVLRYALVPFLLLFSFSFFVLIALGLKYAGIVNLRFLTLKFAEYFGIFGKILDVIVLFDIILIAFLLFLTIPLILLFKDFLKILDRYGMRNPDALKVQKKHKYLVAAKRIFAKNPKVRIFVFGHTHDDFLHKKNGRIVINTGAWIKKLKRIKSRFLLLPSVYYPFFVLSFFKITEKAGKVSITYHNIPKKIKPDLTYLQRFAIITRKHKDIIPKIPKEVTLE